MSTAKPAAIPSRSPQIKVYQFTGQANDRIVLRVNRISGIQPRIQIFRSDGSAVTTQDTWSDNYNWYRAWIDTYTLPSTDTYTVFISDDNGGEPGPSSSRSRRTNNPANPQPIVYGETRRDTITLTTQIKVYQFTGQANDRIVLRVNRISGIQPRIQIFRSDGTVATTQDTWSDNYNWYRAWIDTYTLPSTDTYTVFISDDNGGETGAFVFTLQRSNNPAGVFALQSADTTIGRVLLPTGMSAYSIPARAGDTLWAWVQRDSGSINPLLNMYLADGSSWKAGSGTGALVISAQIVPASGMLWILLGDDNGFEMGRYRISVRISPRAEDIAYGQTIKDSIIVGAPFRLYQCAAEAGDRMILHVNRTDRTLKPGVRVYTPGGIHILGQTPIPDGEAYARTWIDTLKLTSSGYHRITVSHLYGSEEGTFYLTLQRANDPVNASPLDSGKAVTGRVQHPTQMLAYTIGVTEGDTLWATVQRDSGDITPSMSIFLPDGTLLADAKATSGETPATISGVAIPLTGQLGILIGDTAGFVPGRIAISVGYSSGAVIAYGQTIHDSIMSGSHIRRYGFEGIIGDRLILRINRASGSLNPCVVVTNPDGTVGVAQYRVLGDSTYARSWIGNVVLPSSGYYKISVMDSSRSRTGDFYLSLQKSNTPLGAERCAPCNIAGFTGVCLDTTFATILLPTQMNPFVFYGGYRRAVTITAFSDSGSLRPLIELFRPDGTLLARGAWQSSDTSHSSILIPRTELGETKDYFFIVGDRFGSYTGRCSLQIKIEPTIGVKSHPESSSDELPSVYQLCQNYPNPFNPSTEIEYHVPTTSFVTLTLYDLLGREVALLVSGVREPGRHRATVDGTHLSSGVYLCVMRSGDFVGTVRLLLLK
ncbi:MAG: T9SS type A sorting domain-containing protein [Ignavibacteriae bacterium]|nr:T9SS type A sorting domain-containing protein [Ignavibacteriota bacterium]